MHKKINNKVWQNQAWAQKESICNVGICQDDFRYRIFAASYSLNDFITEAQTNILIFDSPDSRCLMIFFSSLSQWFRYQLFNQIKVKVKYNVSSAILIFKSHKYLILQKMDKNKKGKSKNKNISSAIGKHKTQQARKPVMRKGANRLDEAPTKSTLHLSNSFAQPKSTSSSNQAANMHKKKKKQREKSKLLKKRKTKAEKENNSDEDKCDRTLKKFIKKKRDLDNGFEDQLTRQRKQQELTERKRNYLEYFVYRQAYIPIQNTQQRKIIYKIQLIDQNIVRQNKFKINQLAEEEKKQKHQKKDIAIQNTPITEQKIDEQSQTEDENKEIQDLCIESEPQRSFVQTLSEIEFLYLPDEKNFTGFTKSEKIHYKQLLIFLAKKFQEPEKPQLDQDAIQLILNERSLRQRGMIQYKNKTGIPTHTPSIISYISNLFCYIELHQKQNLIDRINCSYGYCSLQKFQRIINNQNTKIQSQLIPETTFWRFQSQLHEGFQFESENVERSLHAHNRAIFDAVNDILLEYQPYYNSRGQPFPWSYNFETTFYYITDESFSALITQIKQKVWEYSTTLAGILIENNEQHKYKTQINRILLAEQAIFKSEIKSYNEKEEVEQHKTRLMVEVADLIQTEIIKQIDLLFQC